MKKIISLINKWFAELSGWLLIIMMFLLIIDFASRGLYRPIQGVGELAVFVLVAVVYFGIPHCEQVRGHVKVTAILNQLPIKIRKVINFIVYLTTFLFLVFLVFSVGRSFIQCYQSGEAVAGTVPIVIWPVRLTIFIGVFFYCIGVMINTIDEFKKLINTSASNIHQ